MNRPRQFYDDDAPLLPPLVVFEKEEPQKTGLY